MKKTWLLIMAGFLALSLAACGKAEQKAEPASASADVKELKIQATNWKFDQPEYRLKKGESVKFTLENKQGVHGLEIKGLNVKLEGSKLSQTVKVDKPGTYDIVCTIPCGQDHLNMKSKLVVE